MHIARAQPRMSRIHVDVLLCRYEGQFRYGRPEGKGKAVFGNWEVGTYVCPLGCRHVSEYVVFVCPCLALGVLILLNLLKQSVCMRSKDWRCQARVTPLQAQPENVHALEGLAQPQAWSAGDASAAPC